MSPSVITRIFAIWGVLLTAAVVLWSDTNIVSDFYQARSEKAAPPKMAPPEVQTPASATTRETRPANSFGFNDNHSSTTFARYRLCESDSSPRLFSLNHDSFNATLAVHCGGSAYILRLDHRTPQLVAQVKFEAIQPQTELIAAPITTFDINDDGRFDLLLGTRRLGANRTPAGGAVYVMTAAERGGFLPPQELLLAHPLDMFAPPISTHDNRPLWIVQGRNEHHGDGPELWSFRKSDTPPRTVLATLPPGSAVLGTADLDLDGESELLVSGRRDGQAGLWLWRLDVASLAEQAFFPLGAITSAEVGDVNGDGHEDAIIAGGSLWTIQAQSQDGIAPRQVKESRCQDKTDFAGEACNMPASIGDLNRDGFADLASYANGQIRIFNGHHDGHFELEKNIDVDGQAFVLHSLRLAEADSAGTPVWIAIIHSTATPSLIEIATLPASPLASDNGPLTFGVHVEDLSHTPLATLDHM